MRIIQTIRDAGRAMVIAFNKWDLVNEERRLLPRARDRARPRAAAVGAADQLHGPHRLARRPARAGDRQGARGLGDAHRHRCAQHVPRSPGVRAPHPVRSGKQPKILFATQPSTAPPTFVLFTSGKLDAAYERYIERRLREEFGFVGTPIVIEQKPREKSASAERRQGVTPALDEPVVGVDRRAAVGAYLQVQVRPGGVAAVADGADGQRRRPPGRRDVGRALVAVPDLGAVRERDDGPQPVGAPRPPPRSRCRQRRRRSARRSPRRSPDRRARPPTAARSGRSPRTAVGRERQHRRHLVGIAGHPYVARTRCRPSRARSRASARRLSAASDRCRSRRRRSSSVVSDRLVSSRTLDSGAACGRGERRATGLPSRRRQRAAGRPDGGWLARSPPGGGASMLGGVSGTSGDLPEMARSGAPKRPVRTIRGSIQRGRWSCGSVPLAPPASRREHSGCSAAW